MNKPSETRYQPQTTYYQQLGEQPLEQFEAQVAEEWQVGNVILDLYEITALLGEGGMGKVFRAHHRGWNLNLAVKCPKAEIFASQQGKEDYIREAETWINLGLHPHIASCYYVRTLGGVPRLFAECVEGGSLESWIDGHRLYEGGKKKALERILDIAIQFAWGLGYAHEQGLVHQDVKPHNVLMTLEGIAKVTDFGLARARAKAGEGTATRVSPLVSAGGYTAAYCSPEQVRKEKLSLKTDIWSWGVSMLEMFTGGVRWQLLGEYAATILEDYLERGAVDADVPAMPPALAELLRHCFIDDPESRPGDMLEVAGTLQGIYQQATGQPYHRDMPKAVDLRADSLNNKALSLLDLGKDEEAVTAWEEALRVHPHHTEATYNLGLWRWRAGQQTDMDLVQQLEDVNRFQTGAWMPYYLLGKVHLQRRDIPAARLALEEAAQLAPGAEQVQASIQRLGEISSAGFLRILQGHTGTVNAVAVTPDGQRAVSGSSDNTLRVWDLASGKCLRILQGSTGEVSTVAITPDGRLAVSGCGALHNVDTKLRVWDLTSGACLRTLEGHTDSVWAVTITPDGRLAVSGSRDRTLRVWDLARGYCVRSLYGHTDSISALAITPDKRHIISSNRVDLWEWDLTSGECLRTLEGHKDGIWAVAFTPDGQRLVTCSLDRTIRVWDLERGICLGILQGHTESVNTLAISPDGRYVISGSSDRTLRVWDLENGACLRTLQGHTNNVFTLAITSDGGQIVSGSGDMTLRVWPMTNIDQIAADWAINRPLVTQEVQSGAVSVKRKLEQAEAALKNGQVGKAADTLRQAFLVPGFERDSALLDLWHNAGQRAGLTRRLLMARLVRTLQGHTGDVKAVAITPDGHQVVSGSADKTLRVWDLNSGECLRSLQGHTSLVNAVAITPDGRQVVSGGTDETLRVWDLESGKCLLKIEDGVERVAAVVITPDGRRAFTGSWESSLKVWDLTSGKCLRNLQGHKGEVNAIAITPDGRRAVSCGNGDFYHPDTTLRVWDLANGECLHILQGHIGRVRAVDITPDGSRALSGSEDNTLMLWDLTNGECLRILDGSTDTVNTVAITPDGHLAISGGAYNDRTLRVWDLDSGECLHTLHGHTSWVNAVAITPNGRFVVSSSWDETLRVWILDWDYEFPEPTDWDEGARPYLKIFLTQHPPTRGGLFQKPKLTWTEVDFQQFMVELGYRGYGWLRPEGVRRRLEEIAKER